MDAISVITVDEAAGGPSLGYSYPESCVAAYWNMGVPWDHEFRSENHSEREHANDQKEKVTTLEVMATRSDKVFGLGDGATSVGAALV